MSIFVRTSTAALFVIAAACTPAADSATPAPSWQQTDAGLSGASSGSEIERYFPLKDGTLYQYRTEKIREGPVASGVLMVKVHRSTSIKGELLKPSGTQAFEFTSLGIATQTKTGAPAFLLKLPLDQANTWLGPHGGKTHIQALNVEAVTKAGEFKGCVKTLEERGGDAPLRIATTLCPDVGIVILEVQSGAEVERAELTYFGPPIEIGPDGVQRVE